MAAFKQASVSAAIAFSPIGPYLAAGTVAGGIDDSFSTTSSLQVFDLDLAGQTSELPVVGSTPVSERFCRLAWGSSSAAGSMGGLIAGGLADGTVCAWDPGALMSLEAQDGREMAPLTSMPKHTSAVRGLDFNPLSSNLLASAGEDGQVCIWDLAVPDSPKLYPPMVESHREGRAGWAALAWNCKLNYILATASIDGAFSVWDLRKQKPTVDRLHDSAGRMRRASALAWHPLVATQVMVASEDDQCPTLQLWDLRNQHAPLRELLGHHKGILSVAWNPEDATQLLTTGYDCRTLLWDVPEGEVRGELPLQAGAGTDVRWSPCHPNLLATATAAWDAQQEGSSDGQVSLYTLAAFQPAASIMGGQSAAAPAQVMKQAPAWLKRPCSVAFGFGGILASFCNSGTVAMSQVVTESEVVEQSTRFEQAMIGGDPTALLGLCDAKAEGLPGEEGETWAFLRVHFQQDPRRHLLEHLGFADSLPKEEAQQAAPDVAAAAAALEGAQLGVSSPAGVDGNAFFDNDDADAFFEELQPTSPKQQTPKSPGLRRSMSPKHREAESGASEAEIERALYVGNYAGAVDICLEAGRLADALLLASMGNAELWAHAQTALMQRAPRPYMKVLAAVQKADMLGLIKARPLDEWRETVAILASFGSGDEWPGLCDALARRLASGGLRHPATLCWICAGNVELAVKHWLSTAGPSGALPTPALQSLLERAVVLGFGAGQQTASPALCELIVQYASILAAQGCMSEAWTYLSLLPGEASSATAELRDRVFRSYRAELAAQPPPFPFVAEDVQAGPKDTPQHQLVQPMPNQAQPPLYGHYMQPAAPPAPAQQHGYDQYYGAAASNGNGNSYAPAYGGTPAPPAAVPGGYQTYGAASTSTPGMYNPVQPRQYSAAPPVQPSGPPQQQPPAPQPSTYGSQPYGGYAPGAQAARAGQTQLLPQRPGRQAAGPPQAPTAPSSAPPAPSSPAPSQAPPPRAAPFVPKPVTVAPTPSQLAPVNTSALGPDLRRAPSKLATPPASAASQAYNPYAQPAAPAAASTPAAPPPSAPAAPSEPPPGTSILNADTSKVSASMRPVVTSMRALYDACAAAAGGNPRSKREMDNNAARLGHLFWQLNEGKLSQHVSEGLVQIASALDARDFATVGNVQASLTSTDWDDCNTWLTALKRLARQRATLQ